MMYAVVASGPSAKDVDLSTLHERCIVIAVNLMFKRVGHATHVYACDANFWIKYYSQVKQRFPLAGLWGAEEECASFNGVHKVKVEYGDGLSKDKDGFVLNAGAGNSGYQAMQLAYFLGATKIVMIGFDCYFDPMVGLHCHRNHEFPLINPSHERLQKWAEAFPALYHDLRKERVKVINTSLASAIKEIPRMGLQEALCA
jgi:hypothetical protein